MKGICAVLFSGLAWAGFATAQPAETSFPTAKHLVMSWVPPYGVSQCLTRLRETYDGAGMKDGLTHLGLQFWTPTMTGGLERPDKSTNDAAVKEFRDWGHANGVRVLLCVFNGAKKWDWPQARAGFAGHPKEFEDRLIAEMERLDLDGIDIDLEGNGNFEKDRQAYVQFISELSQKLHAKNKHLTADSFSYQWNAPNQSWWKDLLPLVDGLTSMGYEETGASAQDWRSYAAQCSACGRNFAKLMLGMPTHKEMWQGNSALDQLKWVRDDSRAGVALWDAQLESAAWRTKEVWTVLGAVRAKP